MSSISNLGGRESLEIAVMFAVIKLVWIHIEYSLVGVDVSKSATGSIFYSIAPCICSII